jgi:hypothetical protein
MREERFAEQCRNEAGTVLPFIALGMTFLLVFLALALDQGVKYSGRTQLQQMVDSASQAAMLALISPGGTTAKATTAARNVVANTKLMGTFNPGDLQVAYGKYDFQTKTFAEIGGENVQAVRVRADKLGGNAFISPLTGSQVGANADSIAALRCRNVVFVQDVSSSFRDDIEGVKVALNFVVDALQAQSNATGIDTRVGLVAFRNIVVPAGSTERLVRPGDDAIRDAIENLSDDAVLCKGQIEQVSLLPPTFVVPACVGSDMRAALTEAEALLGPGRGKLDACEDLVITISDGVPCKITRQNLDQFFGAIIVFGPARPGEPQGGGSTRNETINFVNREMRDFGSIAVLTANSTKPAKPNAFSQAGLDAFLESCPADSINGPQSKAQDDEFAATLISGFGQAFKSGKDPNSMGTEVSNALSTIPPVVVPIER